MRILKSFLCTMRHKKRKMEEKRQLAEYKNPLSRAKRRHEIKRCFKVFFKDVSVKECDAGSQDIRVVCSGIYLNRGNQKDVIGYRHHFDTERDKAYTIYHFMHAYLFCSYGTMLHDPLEYDDKFSFLVIHAYRKGRKN